VLLRRVHGIADPAVTRVCVVERLVDGQGGAHQREALADRKDVGVPRGDGGVDGGRWAACSVGIMWGPGGGREGARAALRRGRAGEGRTWARGVGLDRGLMRKLALRRGHHPEGGGVHSFP